MGGTGERRGSPASGPGTCKAAAKRRSRAQPGLPGPRAGLGGSAARTRAPEGQATPPRQRRPQPNPRGIAAQTNASPPAERADQRRRTGLRAPGGNCRPRRNRALRPSAPPECCGAAVRRRTLFAAQQRQCASQPRSFSGALRGSPRRKGRPRPRALPQGKPFPSARNECGSGRRLVCRTISGPQRLSAVGGLTL